MMDPTPSTPSALRRTAGATALAMSRGLALFLGCFGLLNALAGQMHPGFDINIWWLDVRWLPHAWAVAFVTLSSVALASFAIRPRLRRWRRWATRAALAWLIAVAAINTAVFYEVRARGDLVGGLKLPLSLVVCVCLMGLFVLLPVGRAVRGLGGVRSVAAMLIVAAGLALAFPVAQMAFFGRTSYARPVDAIVVFGAGVYADGTMSLALSDRVATACDLYNDGLSKWLVVSGGPGMGDVHETDAMRREAIAAGVPAERILIDAEGVGTDATVANTGRLFRTHGIERVLAVSHWYHLPRIKMTYQRAGRDVYTTPAVESRPLLRLRYYVAREIAAVWVYYLRPLAPRSCIPPPSA